MLVSYYARLFKTNFPLIKYFDPLGGGNIGQSAGHNSHRIILTLTVFSFVLRHADLFRLIQLYM